MTDLEHILTNLYSAFTRNNFKFKLESIYCIDQIHYNTFLTNDMSTYLLECPESVI